MAVDLQEMFEAAIRAGEHELADAAPRSGAIEEWARIGRRRRVVRRTLQAVAVLPVVAAVGAAMWFGLGDILRDAPVATPTPVPAPSTSGPTAPAPRPSSTPSASSSSTPDPEPKTVEVDGLPSYLEISGTDPLDLARPGWVLAAYRAGGDDPVTTMFLASPEGDRYRLADVDADWVRVDDWEAGAETALVTAGRFDGGYQEATQIGLLDLKTGKIDSYGDSARALDFVGRTAKGAYVWYGSLDQETERQQVRIAFARDDWHSVVLGSAGSSAGLDPSGTVVAVEIEGNDVDFGLVDVTGRADDVQDYEFGVKGKDCSLVGWMARDVLLARCETTGASGPSDAYRVTIDGDKATATMLDADIADVQPWFGTQIIGEDVLALRAFAEGDDEACRASAYVWDRGALVRLPRMGDGQDGRGVAALRATTGSVYIGTETACTFGETAVPVSDVTRYDLASGDTVPLLPTVAGGGAWGWTLGR